MPEMERKGQVLGEGRSALEEIEGRYLRGGKLVASLRVPLVRAGMRH